MLSDPAESRQCAVRTRPGTKAWSDRGDDGVQLGEVLVVRTATANEFPNALDRIEFRAVGRQEMEDKTARDFLRPGLIQTGVVIAGVIDDHDQLRPEDLAMRAILR